MLISPSRADCIFFCDDALVDGSAAFAASLAATLTGCGLASEDDDFSALAPYVRAAGELGCSRACAAVALALAMDASAGEGLAALPPLSVWEASAHSVPQSAPARAAEQVYREAYARFCGLERALFSARWDRLRLPVGILSRREGAELDRALDALGWQDFPRSHVAHPQAAESLCRALGTRWPFFLLGTRADLIAARALGRGDLIAVGRGLSGAEVRFSSAADALRAILGIF